jgi:hypothetical protein
MHAEKATTQSAQSGATASPTPISPSLIGGTPSQVQLQCSVPAGTSCTLGPLDTPVTIVPAPPAQGAVIMIFPSAEG